MASATFGKRKTSLPMGRNSGFVSTATASPAPYTPGAAMGTVPRAPDVQEYRSPASSSGEALRPARPVKFLRFASALIDGLILLGVFIVLVLLFGKTPVEAGNPEAYQAEKLGVFLIFGVFCFLYGIIMEASSFQGTLGKLVTGTRVTDIDGNRITMGRSIGRGFGKLLSGIIPFYIPYLMVFFTKENQSLHDKMAGTLVFKKGEGPENNVGHVFA